MGKGGVDGVSLYSVTSSGRPGRPVSAVRSSEERSKPKLEFI